MVRRDQQDSLIDVTKIRCINKSPAMPGFCFDIVRVRLFYRNREYK